jgi:hypothetical protein
MTTLTLRLPKALAAELAAVAKRRRASQTAILQEALREHLARQAAEPTREYFEKYLREHGKPAPESFAAQAAKYIGCIKGAPPDLSTNTNKQYLNGYGES